MSTQKDWVLSNVHRALIRFVGPTRVRGITLNQIRVNDIHRVRSLGLGQNPGLASVAHVKAASKYFIVIRKYAKILP